MDFGTTHQPQETTDDSALLLSHKVNCRVSHSVSCPTLVIPEREDISCEVQQTELSTTNHAEEIDYGKLLAKHSECCVNPCGVDCPMYPVETTEPKIEELTGSSNPTDCSCSQQLPNTSYDYYWDSATGQYYLLPASQPTQHTAAGHSQCFNGEGLTSQHTPNTSYVGDMYSYGQASTHSSTNSNHYYAAYYAHLYQQYYASYCSSHTSYFASTTSGSEADSSNDFDLPLPMSDRKRRRLLREMNKIAALCQQTSQYSAQNVQPAYNPHYYNHQASSFQPTVLQSDSQCDRSSAFPLVNGQYETPPHSMHSNQHSSHDPRQYPIDIEAIELDALL